MSLKALRQPWLILGLWFLAMTLINLWWLSDNQRRMAVQDSYSYLRLLWVFDSSLDGVQPLAVRDLSVGGRPPLYQLLTVPFLRIFGRSESSALLVNVLFLGILIASTYALGKRLGARRTGILAVFLVTTYPPAVHLARSFTPYYAMFCWSPLSCWAILNLCKKPSVGAMWSMLSTLAIGLLIHPIYAYIFSAPGLAATVYVTFFRTGAKLPISASALGTRLLSTVRDPIVSRGLLPGLFVCAIPVVGWYLADANPLLDLALWLRSPEKAELAGSAIITFGGGDVSPTWLWYLLTSPQVLSIPLAVLGALGILYAIYDRQSATSLLLGTAAVAFVLLGLQPTLAWSRGASVLVIVGALSAHWIVSIKTGAIRVAMIGASVTVGLFNYAHVTWGFQGTPLAIAKLMGSRDAAEDVSRTLALGAAPPKPRRLPVDSVIDLIREDMEQAGTLEGRVLLALPWGRPFIEFYLEDQVSDLSLTSFKQPLLRRGYRVSYLLDCNYILFSTRRQEGKHQYVRATSRFMEDPPESFQRSHELLRVAGSPSLRLWKRARPLSVREAIEVYEAISLADEYKKDDLYLALLADTYLAEGDARNARKMARQVSDWSKIAILERLDHLRPALEKIIED